MLVKLALGSCWSSSGSTSRSSLHARRLSRPVDTAGSFRQRSRCPGLLRWPPCCGAGVVSPRAQRFVRGPEHGARVPAGSEAPLARRWAAAGCWRASQTELRLFSEFALVSSGSRFASRYACGTLGPGLRACRRCLCLRCVFPLPEICSDIYFFFSLGGSPWLRVAPSLAPRCWKRLRAHRKRERAGPCLAGRWWVLSCTARDLLYGEQSWP